MADGTDYAQQTAAVNVIDDILITAYRRIVCYNQPIYEDLHLEPNEYAGLTLGVIYGLTTTITTNLKPMYDQASILILDNDSEFIYVHLSWICEFYFTGATVRLEQTHFIVGRDVSEIVVCARVSFPAQLCSLLKLSSHILTEQQVSSVIHSKKAIIVILRRARCENGI